MENISDILSDFISSYTQRGENVDFTEWLKSKLQQELPNINGASCEEYALEIISAVEDYNKTLAELDSAMQAGYSKEDWLAERMLESCSDMSVSQVGEALQKIENVIDISNFQIIENAEIEEADIDSPCVEFDEYSLKKKSYDVAQKIGFTGLNAAAKALQGKLENGDGFNISDAVKEAFENGLQTDKSEVKAAVAGAVKVAAEKGLAKLSPDMPIEYVGGMAGAAVEAAEAVFDAANGDIPTYEVAEKIGKAYIAAGGNIAKNALEKKLYSLPFGSVLVDLAGGLLEHLTSDTFVNDVYATLKNTVNAAREGIKKSKIVTGVKNLLFGKREEQNQIY